MDYHIEVKRAGGRSRHFRGCIPNEDWSRLLEFRDEVRRMTSHFVRCGITNLNISTTLSWDQDGLRSSSKTDLNDGHMNIILHSIRPFHLKKEPFYFCKMLKILNRHINGNPINMLFRKAKDDFLGRNFQSQVSISSILGADPGQHHTINSEDTLNLWLNAYEYHRDEEKKLLLDDILSSIPRGFGVSVFKSMMIDKIRAIIWLSDFISAIEESPTGRRSANVKKEVLDE